MVLGTAAGHGGPAWTRIVQWALDSAYLCRKMAFERKHPQFRQALIQRYLTRAQEFTPGAARVAQ